MEEYEELLGVEEPTEPFELEIEDGIQDEIFGPCLRSNTKCG